MRIRPFATVFLTGLAAGAAAQTYPVKPIRLVVPNAVGSGPDIAARLVGQKLTEAWAQQVVIDPRPGASGIIGTEFVARAAPDGYTLVLITPTVVNGTLLFPNVRFDMQKDLAPVSLLMTTPYVLAVHPSVPARSVPELIALAKARPDAIHFGSGGAGAMPHLCVEVLKQMTGTRMVHVPYKGFTPALNDLVSGQIQLMCSPTAPLAPFMVSGKVRGLAVTLRQPTALTPGLPTVGATLAGFEVSGWYGLFAPTGVPAEIIARLNAAIATGLKAPDLQERLTALGLVPVASSPQEMGAVLREDLAKWGAVIKAAGLRAE
jgi:tripartite-type tricarboxylate transporter receptor subunit TctC